MNLDPGSGRLLDRHAQVLRISGHILVAGQEDWLHQAEAATMHED